MVDGGAALAKRTCPRCGVAYELDASFCPRDGTRLDGTTDADTRPPDDSYVGARLSGDIELKEVCGSGAMGRVYRGHQTSIERDVAVKILHRELSSNPQLSQRFHREAKIASKLQHPHVVEVYFTGQLPDGALYIVMEYLDGASLATALSQSGGALSLERTLTIALQICDAVGEGHARGIVHRDLKPENVMLVRRAEMGDFVKVLDFGIARVSLGEQSMETQAGLIFGTARYISPEGAQGTTVGPPGDVYSLATMVFQMLAGKTPFDAEQPVGLLIKHIHETPPALDTLVPSIPRAIAKVVMENLSKDPKARCSNARAFGAALAAAARESNVPVHEAGVVGRLSMELSPHRPVPSGIEPTLDDAAAQPAPIIVRSDPAPPPPRDAEPKPPAPTKERRFPFAIVILAFLLGSAIAVLATQQWMRRRDEARDEVIGRARAALADSHYVSPPGNNVRDIVNEGQKKWPKDPELASIRSSAAHEVVTRSMAARSMGDLLGARDSIRAALDLDPTDTSARMLLGQYEEEIQAAPTAATPRLLFELPATAKPNARVEIKCRIVGAGGKPKVTALKATLFENGKTTNGTLIPMIASDPSAIRAAFTLARPGSYDLMFEANVEGRILRAVRDFDVVP